jgi:hypothetical protein
MKTVVLGIFFLVLLYPVAGQAWTGKKDNKSVADLELRQDHELGYEALGPCLYLAFWNSNNKELYVLPSIHKVNIMKKSKEARDYLAAIKAVSKKKHGGEPPRWVGDMLQVASGKDGRQCAAAWMRMYSENIESLTERGHKSRERRDATGIK